ncbi:MAG: hypothetical protein JXA77_12415 [Bacteroidales bacterium]|nr:hypothetical protein [Bacteroidales bacterium]MBN2820003.1 hypothetical protein [Bacteroidales bacterium]
MIKNTLILLLFLSFAFTSKAQTDKKITGDSLKIKGQLSVWTHYNANNNLEWWNGGRYIPQLNYEIKNQSDKMLDFEASANIYGNFGTVPFDTINSSRKIKPYRLWTRYSGEQFEIRLGLQKINFGSASLLRPLMWFDQMDPRDPLQLTDGVWGALGRYYFLNNANIWLWTLYGTEKLKGWEMFPTKNKTPEFGGRIQAPVPKGEAAISYHHRNVDISVLSSRWKKYFYTPENRLAVDARFDLVVGCWLEASWINKQENIRRQTNLEIINIGADYTFGIGNGLSLIFEQLIFAADEEAFEFKNTATFSLLNLGYPIGLFDNLSAIVYYDWANNKTYNFLNWQRQYNKFTFLVMAYMNPKDYNIPTQLTEENLFAGNGIQFMIVFNH